MADGVNAQSLVDALKKSLAQDRAAQQIPTTYFTPKGLVEDIQSKIKGREISYAVVDELSAFKDKHLADAILYGQSQARVHRVEKTLQDFQDHELVMEMIRRGYAAMKLPKDGSPPESLR